MIVILVLLAIIISDVIVSDQNEEQIISMDEMTALEDNEFPTVILPIK